MTQNPKFRSYPSSGTFSAAIRAGWLMLSVGILTLVAGGLFVAFGFLVPQAQLQPEQEQKLHQLEAQLHLSLTTVFVTAGCILALTGIYHIVMSFFVRKGWRGAIYTAIITSFLVIGWCLLSTINGLMFGGGDAAAGVCFLVVILAAFVWQLVWLFQALRGSGSIAAAAQYQAQYWQMLQQQQAYGPPPGVPPPPLSVLAPPPPPEPPLPEPLGWAYGPQTPPPPPPALPPSGAEPVGDNEK